ncbi:hypothetical protein [Belnapia sp. F-4-1]|uniref:hypothetical protein n=1 Tax=Belnapia sp. F-4-1 TaxID=1545443 RepID=UPI0006921B00|nr:hypothetical protein [Belnapia sp. F-4-1]
MPLLALLAVLLALPVAATAQGTAPAQGVTRPIPRPAPEAAPPAPKPGEITDGRPRTDTGGGAANTTPDTTARTPLPPAGQANPPSMR